MASNDRIIGGKRIGKEVEGIDHGLIFGTTRRLPGGLNKTMKIPGWTKNIINHLSQDTRSPDRIRDVPNMKQVQQGEGTIQSNLRNRIIISHKSLTGVFRGCWNIALCT
jgi:hypothetical protein